MDIRESKYLVTSQKQIFQHLHILMKKKCMISVHFGEHDQSFITVILDINEKTKELKFDVAPTSILNKGVMNASKVLFRAEVDGVKVSFRGAHVREGKSDGAAAFVMPIPESIFWLQRREYFRIKIPQCHTGSHCRMAILLKTNDNVHEQIQDLKLIDIGAQGFSFLNQDNDLSPYFLPSEENDNIINATIFLNDGSQSEISFTIKYAIDIKASPTQNHQRVGCMFSEIGTIFESQLQRYIQSIEIQNRNILGN